MWRTDVTYCYCQTIEQWHLDCCYNTYNNLKMHNSCAQCSSIGLYERIFVICGYLLDFMLSIWFSLNFVFGKKSPRNGATSQIRMVHSFDTGHVHVIPHGCIRQKLSVRFRLFFHNGRIRLLFHELWIHNCDPRSFDRIDVFFVFIRRYTGMKIAKPRIVFGSVLWILISNSN